MFALRSSARAGRGTARAELGRLFDSFPIEWRFALPMLPVGMALYYLAWKYLVSFLNEEIGIA